MKRIWEKQLMTGVVEIDTEHLTLIESIDELHEALKSGKGKVVVLETMNFLRNYTKIHFKHEEALLEKYDYPDLERHKKLHMEFIAEITRLGDLIAETNDTNSIMKVTFISMEWLKKHIGIEDRKVAEHIKKIRAEA